MNEYDSARMAELLQAAGYILVPDEKAADIILFNTCTVRANPHHKAISEAGRAIKLKEKRPELIVGIAGCVAQEEKGRLFDLLPGLDLVIGPDQIWRIADLLKEVEKKAEEENTKSVHSEKGGEDIKARRPQLMAVELIDNYEDCYFIPTTRARAGDHGKTSYVTIMKGCNNFCSFCIVPHVRGREVSRKPDEIISEIQTLARAGVREVTLLGQNVNSYSPSFPSLLRRIAEETDVLRLRYTSPHPKDFSDELVEEHCLNPKLCEHVHLPAQSGSTSVLKRMRRLYSREDYLEKVLALKKAIPGIAITTDIIVGFPGETDADFEETLSLMKEVEFDGMFAFKYCTRPGTYAAEKYNDDISDAVKRERLAKVLELNEKIVLQKHQKYVGTRQEILVEGPSKRNDGELTGRTRTNKIVNFRGGAALIGRLVDVEINWAGVNTLKGREPICLSR